MNDFLTNEEKEAAYEARKGELSKKRNKRLISIISGPKMLFLTAMVVIGFVFSIIAVEIVINAFQGIIDFNQIDFNVAPIRIITYLVLIIPAIYALIFVMIYISARQNRFDKLYTWTNALRIYYKVGYYLLIAGVIILFIYLLSLLVYGFGIFLILLILLGAIYGLVIYAYRLIVKFTEELTESFEYRKLAPLVDPSKVLIIAWVGLGLAVISALFGGDALGDNFQNLVVPASINQTVNTVSIIGSILGIIHIIAMILLLRDMKSQYYEDPGLSVLAIKD